MFDAISARGAFRPSLSALTTSITRTDHDYVCPAGVYRLLCASAGGCALEMDERRVSLIGPRMALLTGQTTYRIAQPTADFALTSVDIATEPGQCCEYGIREMAAAFPEFSRVLRQAGRCIVFYDDFAMVQSSLQSMHALSTYNPPERDTQIALTLFFLLAVVATSSWDEDMQSLPYSKHVRAALQYIHENYMCNITTTDVAAAAGVHIGHLHRIFLNETGCRVGEYVTNVRIEKAKSLLMRTDIPTTSVAHRVGVSTLQYFSRLFKQRVGVTPQTFRRTYNLTCDYRSGKRFSTEFGEIGGKSG